MKRILLILLTISLMFPSFAVVEAVQSKRLSLQAGVSETLYLGITPIASQSQAFIMGMPFSVDDTLVQYSYGRLGRQVASWSLMANSPFKIKVEAEALKHSEKDYYLPYYLCFDYSLSYYESGNAFPTTETSAFVVKSDHNSDESLPDVYSSYKLVGSEFTSILDNVSSDSTNFLGTVNGNVYFKFSNTSDVSVDNSNSTEYAIEKAPGGDYTANVKVTVEAGT